LLRRVVGSSPTRGAAHQKCNVLAAVGGRLTSPGSRAPAEEGDTARGGRCCGMRKGYLILAQHGALIIAVGAREDAIALRAVSIVLRWTRCPHAILPRCPTALRASPPHVAARPPGSAAEMACPMAPRAALLRPPINTTQVPNTPNHDQQPYAL